MAHPLSALRALPPGWARAFVHWGSAAVALGALAAPPGHASPDVEFAQGLAAYDRNEWPQAWARLSALADTGHPRAAWLAGMMWQLGPSLYGQHWPASAERLERWAAFSACGGHCAAEPLGPGGC
jgi:hypothetical protein